MTFTEDEIRTALSDEVDGITVLPDVAAMAGRIDRQARLAPVRRFAAGASLALALVAGVAGASALAGGGDDRSQSVSVAHDPGAKKKDRATQGTYTPDFSKDVRADWDEPEPKPEPAPEPKPAPAPAPKPAQMQPKPAPTTTKPAPPSTTAKPAPAPADTTPPPLSVTSPPNGSTVDTAKAVFTGETEPGAKVYVDGIWVEPDANGHWQVALALSPGTNVKRFKAMDPAGNRTYVEHTVHCTAEPARSTFSANQKYGSSAENPPYDVFWGTAMPGAAVKVASAYGYAETVAGSDGSWELKVVFADAPAGKTFEVKVRSGESYKYFTFTRTA